jgi:hypothetical protein
VCRRPGLLSSRLYEYFKEASRQTSASADSSLRKSASSRMPNRPKIHPTDFPAFNSRSRSRIPNLSSPG